MTQNSLKEFLKRKISKNINMNKDWHKSAKIWKIKNQT